MHNAPHLHVILLAAGASTRFADGPKQQALVHGEPMLHRAARMVMGAGAALSVVLGAHARILQPLLADLELDVLFNPDWKSGLGSSIACGVRHVQSQHPESSAILLCLADQPQVDRARLQPLLEAHRQHPQRIVCVDHGPVPGPPCLFPRAFFQELAGCSGPRGASALLQAHCGQCIVLKMPEARMDIDTTADLTRLHALAPQDPVP
jgi:molybdenum cofactor cytidylyltransferase